MESVSEGDTQLTGELSNLEPPSRRTETGYNLIRTTCGYIKKLRRYKWEKILGWDSSQVDRIWSSLEVLPEDLQNLEAPMVGQM